MSNYKQYRQGLDINNRWDDNLLNNSFQMDDRSFSEIIGYVSAFLKKINYYNIQNIKDGNWGQMIENDSILMMVSIINEPIDIFKDFKSEIYNSNDIIVTQDKIYEELVAWVDKIENTWITNLKRHHKRNLVGKIKSLLDDILRIKIDQLMQFIEDSKVNNIRDKPQFEGSKKVLLFSPVPMEEDYTSSQGFINTIYTFEKVILRIQKLIRDDLTSYISKVKLGEFELKGNHQPHSAMYITFALLFESLQTKMNLLSQEHLDFYYRDILKQTPNEPEPSRTTVSFNLLPSVKNSSTIEKGTRLSAGKLFGSKTDILFETCNDLEAHNIELFEMRTLFFNSSPYISFGTDNVLISGVSKNLLISHGKDVQDTRDDWFTFGANKESIRNVEIESKEIGEIGFIIGSPVLILSEGKRNVNIQIYLEETTSKKFFWKYLGQIEKKRNLSLDMAFSMVMSEALIISFSSKDGWAPIENYGIDFNKKQNYITITLELKSSDPAIEINSKILKKLNWPSIKVELNSYAPIYLYSFLKDVKIESIKIDVDVHGMRNLSLYNNLGKIALGKTFDIFGPFPKLESYLMVGKTELFKKKIESLEVSLEWGSLPKDFGGFDTYYKGYSESFSNDSFRIKKFILSDGFWIPLDSDSQSDSALFNTTKCLSPEGYDSVLLNNSTTINFEGLSDLDLNKGLNIKAPLVYDINTQCGFVKLILSSPATCFGTELYQKDISEISVYNALNKKNLPFPNKPFVPKLNSVSINYKASDTIFFDSLNAKKNMGKLIHKRPFWFEDAVVGTRVKKFTLLPNNDSQGYLVLGLKGVIDSPLINLFFYFLRSGSTTSINKNKIKWEYYNSKEWEKFKIIKDGTKGLTKTGTIQLRLPKVEQLNSQINAEELYWLRISTKQNAQHFPKIKRIYFNAVQAVCINDVPMVKGKLFPPSSINKVLGKYPDIKEVIQPGSTYAGTGKESADQFYGRVSERLRHKSRAVSAWDYERLLMDKFDTISVVKCTNLDVNFHPVPGTLKVVVLNSNWTNDERYYFKKPTLKAMKEYLKDRSSAFINIKVINPKVEYLLVNCFVKIEPKYLDNAGLYLIKLNEEISRYLSPVSRINKHVGGIGGYVIPNMLQSYIEELDYVNQVQKLSIEHIIREKNNYSLGVFKGVDRINSSTPWSILNPLKDHRIRLIKKNKKKPNAVMDLNYGNLEIDTDFIIESKTME